MTKHALKKNSFKMNWMLSVSLLLSLTLTPLEALSQSTLNLDPQPSGMLNLDAREQSELAKYIKQCTLDKKNLDSYQKSYEVCASKHELTPGWWQTSWGMVTIGVSAFAVGFIAGVAK